ncbi:MAG: hypothetical protein IT432_02160 [Phycisphaerales bacterium]|nr:hypothetical protein [Phycisphaerales bacterium]
MGQKSVQADKAEWDRKEPPSRKAIAELPRWARVAFASRCARRVQELFRFKSWQNLQEHLDAADRAITLAEEASRLGSTVPSANEACDRALDACNAADDAADFDGDAYVDGGAASIASANAAVAGAYAASSAAHAARAATHTGGTPGAIFDDDTADNEAADGTFANVTVATAHAARAAAHAVRAGANAACAGAAADAENDAFGYDAYAYAAVAKAYADAENAAAGAINEIWADYDLLCSLSRHGEWKDETPVDPDLCGAMSAVGAPDVWSMGKVWSDRIGGLAVTFEVPNGVDDEEAIAKIDEFMSTANDMHRAVGGHGLRLVPAIDETHGVDVRQGASVGSRKITITPSPRDPMDDTRLINAIIHSFPENCKVSDECSQQPVHKPGNSIPRTMSNEAFEKKIQISLVAELEKQNERLDRIATQAPNSDDPITLAEQKSEAITKAQRQMKSWRQIASEAGWKTVVGAFLKEL